MEIKLDSLNAITAYKTFLDLIQKPMSSEAIEAINTLYTGKIIFSKNDFSMFNVRGEFMNNVRRDIIVVNEGKYSLQIHESWLDPKNIRERLLDPMYPKSYRNDRCKIVAGFVVFLSVLSRDTRLILDSIGRCFSKQAITGRGIDVRTVTLKADNPTSILDFINDTILTSLESSLLLYRLEHEITHPIVRERMRSAEYVLRSRKNIIIRYLRNDRTSLNDIFDEELLKHYDFSKEIILKIDELLKEYREDLVSKKNKSLSDKFYLHGAWLPSLSSKHISESKDTDNMFVNTGLFGDLMYSEIFPMLYTDFNGGIDFIMRKMIDISTSKRFGKNPDIAFSQKKDIITSMYKDLEVVIEILGEDTSILIERMSNPEYAVLYPYLL